MAGTAGPASPFWSRQRTQRVRASHRPMMGWGAGRSGPHRGHSWVFALLGTAPRAPPLVPHTSGGPPGAQGPSEVARTRAQRQLEFLGPTAGLRLARSQPGVGLEMAPRDPAGHWHAPLTLEPGRVGRRGRCGLSPCEACPVLGATASPPWETAAPAATGAGGGGTHSREGTPSSRGWAVGALHPFPAPGESPPLSSSHAHPVSPRPLPTKPLPAAAAPAGPALSGPTALQASWGAGLEGSGGLHARPVSCPLPPLALLVS